MTSQTTQPAQMIRHAPTILQRIVGGSVVNSIVAVLLAFVGGGILVSATDTRVALAATYLFSRPADFFDAVWDVTSGTYLALFRGAIYNYTQPTFWEAIRPLGETLTFATPLIAAGLGVALAFRVGLFNIGAQGQILIAAAAAGWVAVSFDLPPVVHLVAALAAGLVGGAIWAGMVGALKAYTGAHEVILTIMLNYAAIYFITFLLRTPVLQAPGQNNPKAAPTPPNAQLPEFFAGSNLHFGLVLAGVAVVGVWFLLDRSALGFRFRMVGENPDAARTAGIDVRLVYIQVMVIAGVLVGLAGASQVLGTVTTGFGPKIDAGIGVEAITVALLGRSRPFGVLAAGLLFGALKAGGFAMQGAMRIPLDLVLVVQSLIVLFIAAPPLLAALIAHRRARIIARAEEISA